MGYLTQGGRTVRFAPPSRLPPGVPSASGITEIKVAACRLDQSESLFDVTLDGIPAPPGLEKESHHLTGHPRVLHLNDHLYRVIHLSDHLPGNIATKEEDTGDVCSEGDDDHEYPTCQTSAMWRRRRSKRGRRLKGKPAYNESGWTNMVLSIVENVLDGW